MKFKKICYSTQLSELYGREGYQSHIEVGREYWCFITPGYGLIEGWYKIKVTYIRSGCMFYVFTDYPNIPEGYFPLSCFIASRLEFAEIDQVKDLSNLSNFGSRNDQKFYRFDSERTIVHNWPNEDTIELSEDDPLYMAACIILKEVK